MLIQRSQVSAFFSNVQIRRATITNALSLYRTEINYPRFQKSENLRDVAASSSPLPPEFRSGQERGTGGIDGVEAKKRLAVFVSGGGSNFRAIYDSIQNGSCNGEIVVVVTNAPTCKAAEFALSRDIPVLAYPPPSSKTSTAAALSEVVRPVGEASLTHELLNVRRQLVDFPLKLFLFR